MIIFKFYRFIIICALYYFRGLSSRLFRRNGVMWCTDILPGSSDWSIFGIRWNDSCCSTVSYSEGQVSFCNHKCVMFFIFKNVDHFHISLETYKLFQEWVLRPWHLSSFLISIISDQESFNLFISLVHLPKAL